MDRCGEPVFEGSEFVVIDNRIPENVQMVIRGALMGAPLILV